MKKLFITSLIATLLIISGVAFATFIDFTEKSTPANADYLWLISGGEDYKVSVTNLRGSSAGSMTSV